MYNKNRFWTKKKPPNVYKNINRNCKGYQLNFYRRVNEVRRYRVVQNIISPLDHFTLTCDVKDHWGFIVWRVSKEGLFLLNE